MSYSRKLYNRIEKLRQEIHELINQHPMALTSCTVVQKSHELDLCISEYQNLQANSDTS